ncbi:MAG: redox-sensing transcriptional repressor Rex [Spirochaetia bacterium]|nr:redox-sensing transcriptional repressor Rex [Spirochaetia bacterium]
MSLAKRANKEKAVPAPSVRRLPMYLNVIRDFRKKGARYISSSSIARVLDLKSIQVRKDLAVTGIFGKPKKGYPTASLMDAIERFLGWDKPRDAVLVGVGNLGRALLGYPAFSWYALNIVAAFDSDPQKIGASVHGMKIGNARTLAARIRNLGIKIAILTVPPNQAQETADILAGAGVEGIWNFTGAKLAVPDHVIVQKEDLSLGFVMLCVKMDRKGRRLPIGPEACDPGFGTNAVI